MTTPLADAEALNDRLGGEFGDLDQNRLNAALDDASALVRTEAGLTWLDINDDLDSVPDIVVTITLSVARRIYENPRGIVHETTGPFSARFGEQAAQAIYLTDTEKEILNRYRTTSGVWTMPTTRSRETESSIDWWEINGGVGPSSDLDWGPM